MSGVRQNLRADEQMGRTVRGNAALLTCECLSLTLFKIEFSDWFSQKLRGAKVCVGGGGGGDKGVAGGLVRPSFSNELSIPRNHRSAGDERLQELGGALYTKPQAEAS